jgi:hypothetical protein
MTYPPPGQPGDPYGQPQQYSQPPADGYAPGQAGAGYGQPPHYTQPETSGYAPPGQGYPAQPGYPSPYGQYGPPPVQPTGKGGAGTAVLIIVVLILMAGGGFAGYLLLGDDEETDTAGDETTTSESTEEDSDDEDGGDGGDGGEAPLGEGLTVSSLGAVTPLPGDPWEFYNGPGGSGQLSTDSHSYYIPHTSSWISYLEVGVLDSSYFPYDPADLTGSANTAMDAWTTSSAFGTTEGLQISETTLTETEVDGRPAALAETTISWTSSSSTSDLYEDVAILLVDVDGVNGFVGMASVPESGTDSRQAAIDALLATTFENEVA